MPVATPEQYRQMLDATQKGGYAYPAINVTSLASASGALKDFAKTTSYKNSRDLKSERFSIRVCHVRQVGLQAWSQYGFAEKYGILDELHTIDYSPNKMRWGDFVYQCRWQPLVTCTALTSPPWWRWRKVYGAIKANIETYTQYLSTRLKVPYTPENSRDITKTSGVNNEPEQ